MENNTDNKLKAIEKALNEIHNILTGGSVLSRYKINLLDFKCHLLLEEAQRISEKNEEERITNRNRTIRKMVLSSCGLFIGMFSLGFILHNPVLCFIILPIINLVAMRETDKAKKFMENYNNYSKNLSSFNKRIKNYIGMIDGRYNKLQSKLYDEEKEATNVLSLAEEWIELYLIDETVKIEDIPLELKDFIIQILRMDLEEESDDLETLLGIAKEKINKESLKRELGL